MRWLQLLFHFGRSTEQASPAGASARGEPANGPTARRPAGPPRGDSTRRRSKRASPRQAGYDALVEEMKARYGFRVRKWRRSMSGCAWELLYSDGRRQAMLESPYPKSPMSCAIFLHDVGHHAIGLGAVKPRCLDEWRAWQWSLAAMEERGLPIDDKVRVRVRRSMEYAVAKASRRGIRSLPDELRVFCPRPPAGVDATR